MKLGETDKKLLREMAEGSRLRHPATSLLSPKMLDWSRQVWRDEMGTRKVNDLKYKRIDHICVQLFDQVTPSTSQEQLAQAIAEQQVN